MKPSQHAQDDNNQRLVRMATYASVATALTLIGLKTWAWYATSSVALLSSLVDSLMDGFASMVTLVTVAQALVPPDKEHRFGHGKAESLGALTQAAFITASAIFLLIEATNRLYAPKPLTSTGTGVVVMFISIVLTLGLLGFQFLVLKRRNSIAIKADALHYLGDLLPNIGVILTLWLAGPLGWQLLDPIFAICIAVYLLINAWKVAREALDMLMDRELPDEDRKAIWDKAIAHGEVLSVRDLRTRQSGAMIFIQMDLELAPDLTLQDAHDVADAVTGDILAVYPHAEVMVHQFPKGAHDHGND